MRWSWQRVSLCLGLALSGAAPVWAAERITIAARIDDLSSLDPAVAFERSSSDLLNNLYDTLVEIDPATGMIVPGLAESWTVAPDGLSFRFKIRAGAVFQSGHPVRAEDALYSLRRVVELDHAPAAILRQIGLTPETIAEQLSVEEGDLVLRTREAFAPSFVYNCLSATAASIVDELALRAQSQQPLAEDVLRLKAAGSGAYRLIDFTPDKGYLLEAQPNYWRGAPLSHVIELRHIPEPEVQLAALTSGAVDIARNLSPEGHQQVAAQEGLRSASELAGGIYYLAANQELPLFRNPAVLDAMRWLVDYEGMSRDFLRGEVIPHQSIIPRGYLGALEDTPYRFDPERGKALLHMAGDGPFEAELLVRDSADRLRMAEVIADGFARAGIKITLKVASGAEALQIYRARGHQLTLQAWTPDYPDPHSNTAAFVMNPDDDGPQSGGGLVAWRNHYHSGALEALAHEALMAPDAAARAALYAKLQTAYREDAPIIPMFQEVARTAMQSSVSGFHPGATRGHAAYWLIDRAE